MTTEEILVDLVGALSALSFVLFLLSIRLWIRLREEIRRQSQSDPEFMWDQNGRPWRERK
jgi:hypothetical protein